MTKKLSKRRFSGFSTSDSSSPFSLADFNFLILRFLVWVISIPLPGQKYPGLSRSRLDSGTHNGASGAI